MFSTIAACALAATFVTPVETTPSTVAANTAASATTVLERPVIAPRPKLLISLYTSLATLQALDLHSTRSAISSGAGREANPALRGIVGNPAAFIAVKAATTGAAIWATERLRKEHPRIAIGLMAVLNSTMAAVVAHNYSLR